MLTGMTICIIYGLCIVKVHALTTNILSVYRYQQQNSQWCWAACAQMEGKYLTGSFRAQWEMVNFILGNPDANQGVNSLQLRNACKYATYNNHSFGETGSFLYYSSYKTNIDQSKPLVLWLSNYDYGSGNHVVFAYGYLPYENTDGIRFYDPLKQVNNVSTITHTKLRYGYDSAVGQWTNTICP